MTDTERTPTARLRPGARATAKPAQHRRLTPTGDSDAGQGAAGVVREWHDLPAEERRAAWVELVDWVTWLHDRYELAVEHRLPHCWPHHPGLIEELTALKAWRAEIYTADAPAGQAARYWHAELRQLIQAATTLYAPNCRAGHKTAPATAAGDAQLRTTWLSADPLAGVPADLITVTAGSANGGTALTDPEMFDAMHRGDARPLGQQMTDLIRYRESWWIPDPDSHGWIQITDPLISQDLDRAAQRMALADHAVQTETNRRGNQPDDQDRSSR